MIREVCGKISSLAIDVGEMDITITKLQDKGYKQSAELYVELQLAELDQLHKLTLFLTDLLMPEEKNKKTGANNERNTSNQFQIKKEYIDEDDEDAIDEEKAKELKEIYSNLMKNSATTSNRNYANPVLRKAGYERGKHAK